MSPTERLPVPCHAPTGRLAVTTWRDEVSGARHDASAMAHTATSAHTGREIGTRINGRSRANGGSANRAPLAQPVAQRVEVVDMIGGRIAGKTGNHDPAGARGTELLHADRPAFEHR